MSEKRKKKPGSIYAGLTHAAAKCEPNYADVAQGMTHASPVANDLGAANTYLTNDTSTWSKEDLNNFYVNKDGIVVPRTYSNANIDDLKLLFNYKDIPEEKGPVLISDVESAIKETADEVRDLLLSKNRAYGNSAINPRKIFSKLNAEEAILARLDDKICRIENKGVNDDTEDTVKDVIGYLILLMVVRKLKKDGKL